MLRRRSPHFTLLIALLFVFSACSSEAPVETPDVEEQYDDDVRMPPLDSLDNYDGAPPNDSLPSLAKADEIFPSSFDLLDTQSPVRSQGGRGVCSIFSTVGLMEHLYIKEGTLEDPDFSEQFLQWSAKVEVGGFTNTEGSNASSNLAAISRYGVVTEDQWTYESSPWDTSNDEACTGDARPIRCYTNGDPRDEVKNGPRYKLPASNWVSTRTRDLKAYMFNNQRAIVVGGDFYYQAWNHRSSQLPTNRENWRRGIVTYPNDADKEDSRARRAGHSILLVGWNDDLEVELLDGEGNVQLDDEGNPITEKGFFLFKNSWGTGSFGSDDIDGYGWISYRYVQEFKSARSAPEPQAHHFPDIELTCEDWQVACGDQCITQDVNNCGACGVSCGENQACETGQCVDLSCNASNPDCNDPICWSLNSCIGTEETFTFNNVAIIPDNNTNGLVTTLEVPGGGVIQSLEVDLFIEHPYNGDLSVELTHPSGAVVSLVDDDGTAGIDIIELFAVDAFDTLDAAGTYELKIVDHAPLDEGELVSWSLHMKRR